MDETKIICFIVIQARLDTEIDPIRISICSVHPFQKAKVRHGKDTSL
jgi:hypothetical protein